MWWGWLGLECGRWGWGWVRRAVSGRVQFGGLPNSCGFDVGWVPCGFAGIVSDRVIILGRAELGSVGLCRSGFG